MIAGVVGKVKPENVNTNVVAADTQPETEKAKVAVSENEMPDQPREGATPESTGAHTEHGFRVDPKGHANPDSR